jgi:hypothetical protein
MVWALEETREDFGDPRQFAMEVIRLRLYAMQEEFDFVDVLLVAAEGEGLKRPSSERRIARAKAGMKAAWQQVTVAGEDIGKGLVGGAWRSLVDLAPGEFALEERGDALRCFLRAIRQRMTRLRRQLDLLLVLVAVLGRTCTRARSGPLARAKRTIREARDRFDGAVEEIARVYSEECGGCGRRGGGKLVRDLEVAALVGPSVCAPPDDERGPGPRARSRGAKRRAKRARP